MIATFPCGNKIIRERPEWNIRYFHGLKLNGNRPRLIQVFVTDITYHDKDEIYGSLRKTLHPKYGTMTINGEYLCLMN